MVLPSTLKELPSRSARFAQAVLALIVSWTLVQAVASLPPEQMFQLMQQMKLCIQNNPQEARQMLMQNPQLAYALLQAQVPSCVLSHPYLSQVVMRIVDPETALQMLHKTPPPVAPIGVDSSRPPVAPPSSYAPPFPGALMSGGSAREFPPPGMAPAPRAPYMEPRMEQRPPYQEMEVKQEPGGGRRDPRSRDPRDRGGPVAPGRPPMQGGGMGPGQRPGGPPPVQARGPPQLPPHLAGADPEKAQLIMQV